jgi:ABC-2 type transport system permease protein
MNTASSATYEPFEARPITPAKAMPAGRLLYWSIQRELWENRSIYFTPIIVAAVFLIGFVIGAFRMHYLQMALELPPVEQRHHILHPFGFVAGLLMAVAVVVGVFYCLETLHGERRDRSILFWKSLPVSDLTTVLAKASVPMGILQLITFAVLLVTQCIMLLLSSAILMGTSLNLATLWTDVSPLRMSLMLLYHLITVHALWHAPIYGWMLLVSGWARRAAILWAVIPPAAICIIERIAFGSSYFARLLAYRLSGPQDFAFTQHGFDLTMHMEFGKFLATPGLWTGLVVAAIFLYAAAQQRRYRGPI